MEEFSLIIQNKQGIHLKPASELARIAMSFKDAKILIKKGNASADAKSVMSILSLEITHRSNITFQIEGDEASQCKKEILQLVEKKLL